MASQLAGGQESGKYLVERELVIAAHREVVFQYFTDSERWARWWGVGSTIEPRVGAPFLIRYPNGATASGAVLEIAPPERLVLSYGYDDPSKPIAPGGSRVVISLAEHPRAGRFSHCGIMSIPRRFAKCMCRAGGIRWPCLRSS